MTVKWTENIFPVPLNSLDTYPETLADFSSVVREGEIIGTHVGFLSTKLIVACSDKRVRTVDADLVEVVG